MRIEIDNTFPILPDSAPMSPILETFETDAASAVSIPEPVEMDTPRSLFFDFFAAKAKRDKNESDPQLTLKAYSACAKMCDFSNRFLHDLVLVHEMQLAKRQKTDEEVTAIFQQYLKQCNLLLFHTCAGIKIARECANKINTSEADESACFIQNTFSKIDCNPIGWDAFKMTRNILMLF